MRTKKQNRLAKRYKRGLVLVTVLALIAALASVVYISGWVINHTPVTADPANAGARGILLPPLPHRALAPPLTADPHVAAALDSMNEMSDVDEFMYLVFQQLLLKAQVVQYEALDRQIIETLNEPPGNAAPAELERYERNTVGGIDDYGAVEQEFTQVVVDGHNQMITSYLQQLERRRLVWRIDTYLQKVGSPMYGCGEYFVQGQERTGIPATLPVGIAYAESSAGLKTYRHPPRFAWPPPPQQTYNAYGMIGPEYYFGFGSWEAGIQANFDYLVKHFGCPQNMHQCPGYCEGNTTMQTVDGVQATINGYDASVVH